MGFSCLSKNYRNFLNKKSEENISTGFDPIFIPEILFDFQADLTAWAIRKGKAAIWAGCGLGKTLMQLTWAANVCEYTNKPVLILAPLGVTAQTKREALDKLNITVDICRKQTDCGKSINITNYENLHNFNTSEFSGVVLDESSILKNYSGKIKQQIIDSFAKTEFKLCCSATPSPNDYTEIGNHAEFLNVCSRTEMLATYFIHDSGSTQKWRLKGHAEKEFFKWVSTWAVMIEKPSDIGYDDHSMILPQLNFFEHKVESKLEQGEMFCVAAQTLKERRDARRKSIKERCQLAAQINQTIDGICLNWCDLNDESAMLTGMIDSAVEVKGPDKNELKEKNMLAFAKGEIKSLVTKPKIAQFGMNWQVCSNMCFVGLSDSFESFYQAMRRCYRFGQKKPVNVHIIISEKEGSVLENIKRKEANASAMLKKMVKHISINTTKNIKKTTTTEAKKTIKFKPPKFMEVA